MKNLCENDFTEIEPIEPDRDIFTAEEVAKLLVENNGVRKSKANEWLEVHKNDKFFESDICDIAIALTRGIMEDVIDPATGEPKKPDYTYIN